ncbi:lipoyl synthase [Nitrospirota bacterium]
MKAGEHKRLPHWLRRKHSISELHAMKSMLRGHGLNTVCEEARCPNKAECFSRPTATFLILGPECTRSCSFCCVGHGRGKEMPAPDFDEPGRVAKAAREMGLRYVVVTSVTRDDLRDGGASMFADTVKAVRYETREARVEVLVPDFKGDRDAVRTVVSAGPDVFNHNIETVPSLYPEVRPQAEHSRSLMVLGYAKEINPDIRTKSGLMLGLGETMDEVLKTLHDLKMAGCDMVTIGQYMRPSIASIPVTEYIRPEVFDKLRDIALEMGFGSVASAPLVRSSMNAEEIYSHNRPGDMNVRV